MVDFYVAFLAVRTYALYERTRSILVVLTMMSIVGIIVTVVSNNNIIIIDRVH